MDDSDVQLVARANAGDGSAFGQLIEKHYDTIFRVAFGMMGNRADAEDVAQDICAGLPGKLRAYRGDARVSSWLYRIAINAAKDRLRRRTTRNRAAAQWGDLTVLRRQTDEVDKEQLDWLHAAMTKLPEDLRETVTLVLGEDLTHAQAADVLGLSEGTVSWRMSEVRKALRTIAKAEERIQ